MNATRIFCLIIAVSVSFSCQSKKKKKSVPESVAPASPGAAAVVPAPPQPITSETVADEVGNAFEKESFSGCAGGIAHMGSVNRIMFREPMAELAVGCVSEVQVSQCNNGVLGPYSGTFTAESCSIIGAPEISAPVAPLSAKITGGGNARIPGDVINCEVEWDAGLPEATRNPLILWQNVSGKNAGADYTIGTADIGNTVSCEVVNQGEAGLLSSAVRSPGFILGSLLDTPIYTGGQGLAVGEEIEMHGDLAAIANNQIQMFDLSSPENPQFLALIQSVHNAQGMKIVGNRLHVADWLEGYKIFDISDPSNPVLVSTLSMPAGSLLKGVAVREQFVYLAATAGGLIVLDITDESSPQLVAQLQKENSNAIEVFVSNDRLLLAEGPEGLSIIDVSNPVQPVQIGSFANGHSFQDACLQGNNVYAANDVNGFLILSIEDPANPVPLGRFDTKSYAMQVRMKGAVAYLASWWQFHVIDVTDPQNMFGKMLSPNLGSQSVAVKDEYVISIAPAHESYFNGGGLNVLKLWQTMN